MRRRVARDAVICFLRQSLLVDRLRCLARHPRGVAAVRAPLAKSWLHDGSARSLHHPRSQLGRAGAGGFENKVFYVWFDAPIAYIAAAQEWAEEDPARRLAGLVVAGG